MFSESFMISLILGIPISLCIFHFNDLLIISTKNNSFINIWAIFDPFWSGICLIGLEEVRKLELDPDLEN